MYKIILDLNNEVRIEVAESKQTPYILKNSFNNTINYVMYGDDIEELKHKFYNEIVENLQIAILGE